MIALTHLQGWLQRFEDFLLGGLLLVMIVLAAAQILFRNLFDSGLIWGDEVLRSLVLWTGLVGAVVASRERRHITIDVLSRLLPSWLQPRVARAVSLFTGIVCGLLAWHSARFVAAEYRFGASGPGGWPGAWFELVLPVSFSLISLRYLLDACTGKGPPVSRGGGE